jgi:transcriptional regulator with XRE-family HTH domain
LHTSAVPKSAFTRKQAQLRGMLVQARHAAGLTQMALSRKLGKPQSFVSKYEGGERRLDVVEFLEITRALRADAVRIIKMLDT